MREHENSAFEELLVPAEKNEGESPGEAGGLRKRKREKSKQTSSPSNIKSFKPPHRRKKDFQDVFDAERILLIHLIRVSVLMRPMEEFGAKTS